MIRKHRYDPENGIVTVAYPNAAAFIAADTGEKDCWIDADRMDEEQARLLAKHLGLHPIVIEDMFRRVQRATLEDYGNYAHLLLNVVLPNNGVEIRVKKAHILLWEDRILTVCHDSKEIFRTTFEILEKGALRPKLPVVNQIFYFAVCDIARGYFNTLDKIGHRIDALEEQILERVEDEQLARIHALKNAAMALKRALWPMRETMEVVVRGGTDLLAEDVYLHDAYVRIKQAAEITEQYREMLSDLTDLYLSGVNNRMNEVMKLLAIVSTLFIPITFIAGVYGMNFLHMPELNWRYGYPLCLLMMAAVSGGMIAYFKRKKWF